MGLVLYLKSTMWSKYSPSLLPVIKYYLNLNIENYTTKNIGVIQLV